MIRRIVLIFLMGSASSIYAKDSQITIQDCEVVLGAGIFNGLLEEVCGFEGGVKDQFLSLYDKFHCRQMVPQKNVDEMAKNVAEDTKMRVKAFGLKTFCKENMKHYADLVPKG